MKVIRVISLLAILLMAAPSRAEEIPGCAVPAYLLATESALPKVASAIKTRKRLEILVVGSGSSALPGADGVGMSYPARTEAALREALHGFLAIEGDFMLETRYAARNGDLALISNSWRLVGKDPSGQPLELTGRSAEVVRRQPDGRWLFMLDHAYGGQ